MTTGITVASGCHGGFGGSSDQMISMTADLRFNPADITISSGQQVTWEDESRVAHTTSDCEESLPEPASYFASGGYESEQTVPQSTAVMDFLERSDTYPIPSTHGDESVFLPAE